MPQQCETAPGGPPSRREPIEPIYSRLPRGPHSLDPQQIAAHQRARIRGAMVEAVARRGYDRVTVRQVIGLAAVSRRSFYEHFANRHDCFLKTARTIAAAGIGTARAACATEPEDPEAALSSGVEALVAYALERPAAAKLALVETLRAGEAGAVVLGETLGAYEGLLGTALAAIAGRSTDVPPAGTVRALAGALHAMLAAGLDGTRANGAPALATEMTAIARALVPPPGEGPELSRLLRERERRVAIAASSLAGAAPAPPPDVRARLLLSAMRLAALQPVEQLGAAQIADGAGVPVDEFDDLFADRDACVQEALSSSARRLLAIARRAAELAADPPQATRLALAGMLGELAANPHEAHALALVANRAGAAAEGVRANLDAELGAALLGALGRAAPPPEAAAGAFWHTVRSSLLSARTPLLAALSDHLSYALLAPAIGSGAAIDALRGGGGAQVSGGARGARRSA